MDDISNKTLATLLIAAVVISLGGTLVALNRLQNVPTVLGRAATDLGNATATVTSSVSILLYQDVINWGSGYVNTSKTNCKTSAQSGHGANLTTGPNAASDSDGTDQDDCWTGTSAGSDFRLQNDGNVNVSVTVNTTTDNPLKITNSNCAGTCDPSPVFRWQARNIDAGSCATGNSSTWYDFNTTPQTICSQLVSPASGSNNKMALMVWLQIPGNIKAGTYEEAQVLFTAATTE